MSAIPSWIVPGINVVYEATGGPFGAGSGGTISLTVESISGNTVTEQVVATSTGGVEEVNTSVPFTPGTPGAFGYQFWVNPSITNPPYDVESLGGGLYSFDANETYEGPNAAYDGVAFTAVSYSFNNGVQQEQSGIDYADTNDLILQMGDQFTNIADYGDGSFQYYLISDNLPPINPPPPGGTTATMVMNNPNNGDVEIYDIGGNQVLAAYSLGPLLASLSFVGLGTLQAGDTNDILVRNSSTGEFGVYYVQGNTAFSSAVVGAVGTNWAFEGLGDYDGASSLSELLLRNANSGAFELYRVAGGGVLSGSAVAAVGNNFSVKGVGDFSGSATTQMMMQDNSGDASNGQLELYTYQPGTASFGGIDVGKVGSNLSIVGTADLLGNGQTQIVMEQNNGKYWLYSYSAATNSLSGTLVGAIGSNFHVVGFGQLGGAGQDEMLMQDAAGDFEVYQYNATLNAFVGNSMGKVGAPWVVDGIAAAQAGGSSDASTAQLVQAMASMGTNSFIGSGIGAPAGLETAPQTLLTAPQHA
jgi:hypothetical protein